MEGTWCKSLKKEWIEDKHIAAGVGEKCVMIRVNQHRNTHKRLKQKDRQRFVFAFFEGRE